MAQNEIKAYVIYVSSFEYKGSTDQLKEFIAQNKLVRTWWNYIPFVYVITSEATAIDLKTAFKRFIGEGVDILIAETEVHNLTGVAPINAWKAFDEDIRRVIDPDYVSNNTATT